MKGQPNLTGRQALNACRAASINTLWAVKGSKYGQQDPNYSTHATQCLGSLGMSGTGEFFGYPNGHSLKWMVISGMAKNGERYTLPFDARTGGLATRDDVAETVDAWYGVTGG